MRARISALMAVAVVAVSSPAGAAPPVVGPIHADPPQLVVDQSALVAFSVAIQDLTYIPGSANLQRRNANNTWTVVGTLRDDGSGGDPVANDGIFTVRINVQQAATGEIQLRASAAFKGMVRRLFSSVFDLPVGVPLPAGVGGFVSGNSGTGITVPDGAIPFNALVGVEPQPATNIVAPPGDLPVVGALKVILQPTSFNDTAAPVTGLKLSIPAPPSTSATEFIIARQVVADFTGENPGLREQLLVVDTATLIGGQIVGDGGTHINGVFEGGDFVVLENVGSGFVTGTVLDGGVARAGAVVSNDTNTLITVTGALGGYTLYISGGPFQVTAFDPFRGKAGSASGTIVIHGDTVNANISMTPVPASAPTRDGIRNAGFERGDVTSWIVVGSATASQQLTSTTSGGNLGITILPTEGQWFGDINTGTGAAGALGSSLTQDFIVPAGAKILTFDYDFVSEEFPEFVESQFDDSFRALITTPNGDTTIAEVSVNASQGFTLIGDCGFPGGDVTCGHTGWRTGSVDLSAFGAGQRITVRLLFSAEDRGDSIFDTHVLIDNLRFSTVWIDAKIVNGAAADEARVRANVVAANEILSQAGINVRIRRVLGVPDPASLLVTDLSWVTPDTCPDGRLNAHLTSEETVLMGLQRSAILSDLNAYYVQSGNGTNISNPDGFAIGPDDFCVDVNIGTNAGVLVMDIGDGNTLAHVIGHLLISPARLDSTLEHEADAGNFMRPGAPPLGVLNRDQSANINRIGAPLLVP